MSPTKAMTFDEAIEDAERRGHKAQAVRNGLAAERIDPDLCWRCENDPERCDCTYLDRRSDDEQAAQC